ncbi:N-acetylmuramoyl-L-alanine amidase [Cellulomonas sp. URHB0016]
MARRTRGLCSAGAVLALLVVGLLPGPAAAAGTGSTAGQEPSAPVTAPAPTPTPSVTEPAPIPSVTDAAPTPTVTAPAPSVTSTAPAPAPSHSLLATARGSLSAEPRPSSFTPHALDPGTGTDLSVELETAPFTLAAVTWTDGSATVGVEISVRTSGVWTAPQTLEAEEGGESGRGGTAPLISVDPSTAVRVHLSRAAGAAWPAGLRLDLVDAGTGPAAPSASARSVSPDASTDASASVMSAAVGQPDIITRAQWGADESINTNIPSPARFLNVAFVHHTATTNAYGPADSAAQVRSIYEYHVHGRGWPDIGYNFLVDRYGQIFEGRSGGIELPEVGAHAGSGFNTGSVGVAAIGTFDASVPAIVPERISQVIAWKFGLHQVDPYSTVAMTSGGEGNVRWPAGTTVYLPAISGHRHTSFTDCPGEALFAYLPAIRDRVSTLLAQAANTPWLAGTFDGLRLQGDRVTAYGWAVSTEAPGQAPTVRVRTWSRSATGSTGVARPDVAAIHPELGGRTGYEVSLTLPRGGYQVCVDVTTAGRPTVTVACRWITVAAGRIVGNFEEVQPRIGGATVRGWALQVGAGGSNKVHAYLDGHWAAELSADGSRPDVAAAYPADGAAHGFSANLSVAAGSHEVCLYVISLLSSETNPLLGCRQVTVPSGAPVGHLEDVVGGDGSAHLVGWAFDPEVDAPIDVHVYRNGAWAGLVRAGVARGDVQRAYGLPSAAHGFTLDIGLPTGVQQVCAYGINQGTPATNPSLGCRTVGVPLGNPFGSLDVAGRSGGTARLVGWVIDPDTRGATAVHVYVDGRWGGAFVADQLRADVGRAYPTLAARHGFDVAVPVGSGPHTACVYAINSGVGSTNPLVGCASIAG